MADSKMEQTKQLLVRFIRDNRLKKGDKLPGQAFLRKTFDCGSVTVLSAIHALRNDGVLEVRDKVGVYVIDPNADGHAGRVVGITARHVEGSPYYSTLLGALQMRLVREGCRVNIFGYSSRESDNPFDFTLDDFPGLRRSIEDGEIHGMIHLDDFKKPALDFLRRRKIPTLFCGSTGISPDGVFLNQEDVLRKMYLEASAAGCGRIGLQLPGAIRKYLEPLFLELGGKPDSVFPVCTAEDGRQLAERVIAMPASKRPDALLCFDDIVAQWMFGTLVLALPKNALPRAWVVRNRQLMMCFPLPDVIFYDIDLLAFAGLAAETLLDAMKNNAVGIGRISYNIGAGE